MSVSLVLAAAVVELPAGLPVQDTEVVVEAQAVINVLFFRACKRLIHIRIVWVEPLAPVRQLQLPVVMHLVQQLLAIQLRDLLAVRSKSTPVMVVL